MIWLVAAWRKISVNRATGTTLQPIRSAKTCPGPTDGSWSTSGYEDIQFTKAPHVLRGMGVAHLSKSQQAIEELTEKGMAPA